MSPLFYALAFVAGVLALEGAHALLSDGRGRRRATTRKRLRKMTESLRDPEVSGESDSLLRGQERRGRLDTLLSAVPGRKEIELRLYRAGLTIRPERFLALSGAMALGGWLLGTLFLGDAGKSLLLAGAGLLPWLQVGRLHAKRIATFEKQFPDALDLLIRALRAGHSLTTGFAMVGKELPDPIGCELAQVADEVQVGKTMRDALSNLAYRIDSPDLPFFVTAVSIQQETGSNLAEVLENLSSVMRERFKVLGKVRALTAMGRASANLLAAWPFVTVAALYVVNPDYVSPLWESPAGHTLVLISLFLIAVGYVLCRKMAQIRV